MVEQMYAPVDKKVEGKKSIPLQFAGDVHLDGIVDPGLSLKDPKTFDNFKEKVHEWLSGKGKNSILEYASNVGHDVLAFVASHQDPILRTGVGVAASVASGAALGVIIYQHFHDKESQNEEKPD